MTSFTPLKVYIYKQGLIRFATKKYTDEPECHDELKEYLANYNTSNTDDEDFVGSQDGTVSHGIGGVSSKSDFSMLR